MNNKNIITLALCAVAGFSAHAQNLILNGDFEAGAANWAVTSQDANPPSVQLNSIADFNFGDQTANAVITQSFATVPGKQYKLRFDYGTYAFALGSYPPQAIHVVVGGGGTVLDQIVVSPPNTGGPVNTRFSYPFVAASGSFSYLQFIDLPGNFTFNLDGILDNVAVYEAETNAPTVKILTPKANLRITNDFDVSVSGTAADVGTGVEHVYVRVNGGGYSEAIGTTNFGAVVHASPGTNVLEVKAVDIVGNETVVSRVFFEVVFSTLHLSTNGLGGITSTPSTLGTPTDNATLEVGRPYKLTAIPGVDNLFSNWTGTITSENPKLTFVMQDSMTLTANFVHNPFIRTAGKYNGLFSQETIAHDSSGFFTFKLKTNGAFGGKITLDGETFSIKGKFRLDGSCMTNVSRAKVGKGDLMLHLQLGIAGGQLDTVNGAVLATNFVANMHGVREAFGPTNQATAFTNLFTMLVPGFSNTTNGPSGYGYAALSVNTNGLVKIGVGALADGAVIKQAVGISKNGEWPFYAPLYKATHVYSNEVKHVMATNSSYYTGSIIGWLTFDPEPSGTVNWIRPASTNALYPAGFTNYVNVAASVYTNPAPGALAVDLPSGFCFLTGGNLSSNYALPFTLGTNNVFSIANGVILSVVPKNGSIKGSFVSPANPAKPTKIFGAVLQSQDYVGGYFLGTNIAGKVLLNDP
jgi:hypothetical protein